VTGCHDAQVLLWDVTTHKPLGPPLMDGQDQVWTAAFSPDGKTIRSGSADGTARLWPAPVPLASEAERLVT
jgi:WD40 repeat protein